MSKEKKIVPQSSWKSLELIVRENPDMTGREAQEEFKYGKKCYELWQTQRDQKLHDLAAELKKNKYYKIQYKTGGSGLITYLEITDAFVVKEEHHSTVYFHAFKSNLSNRRVVGEPNGLNIETLQVENHEHWDNYVTGNDECETVTVLTKTQYDSFQNAVKALYNL